MAEVLVLDYADSKAPVARIMAEKTTHFNTLPCLVSFLFRKGNTEKDTNRTTVVVLDTSDVTSGTSLDRLPHSEKVLLLRYFFNHLNLMVIDIQSAADPEIVRKLNAAIVEIDILVGFRIPRVETWTGTGSRSVNDFYLEEAEDDLRVQVSEVVSTMTFVLSHNCNKTPSTEERITRLNALIMENVDFKLLLADNSEANLQRLCHFVGHWSFPAHELSNDDLVYCVFLIISYAMGFLKNEIVPVCGSPTSNELLGFVFMVRDTYKNGNPFHNFRHAVDVLQACFHYLVRLKCLPEFEQFEKDPRADEMAYLAGKKLPLPFTELIATSKIFASAQDLQSLVPHLNPLQSLGLLIAALGHDVGHPGVTNAFLIKHASPTSQLYSERSVLELYHSTVFINKVLSINFPGLLTIDTDPTSKLTLKKLIIGSILATDMAEHFEYIHKLKEFKMHASDPIDDKVRLISSLLIKCADISNVTRPLRMSSQWAVALSREFDEVDILDTKITSHGEVKVDVSYSKLPSTLDEVLQSNPYIHKGQIFFIQTFAEGLFNSILELLPELRYTCDIIQDNKLFWLARAQSM